MVGGAVGLGGLLNGLGFLEGGLLLFPPPPPKKVPKRPGNTALASPPSPPPPPPPPPPTLGGAEAPPPPPPAFNKVPRTGNKAPKAPASLFPVAALKEAAKSLPKNLNHPIYWLDLP